MKEKRKTHWEVWAALALIIALHAVADISKKNAARDAYNQAIQEQQARESNLVRPVNLLEGY